MNPQSLNADAVLTAVQQGHAPAHWQVLRARVGYHVRQILGGVFLLLLGFVGVLILLANPDSAYLPGSGGNNVLDPGPFAAARTFDFVVLAIVLLVSLGLSAFAASQLATVRDQMLVLMPEGFVIYARKPMAYDFAGIQAMTARNNRGTITFNVTPVGGGRSQTFRLDGRFGNAKEIATRILSARGDWQRMHPAPTPQAAPPPQFPQEFPQAPMPPTPPTPGR